MNTQLESLKTLRDGIATLAPGDQGFAASLIVQYDAKGELTEKQWYWIERLAADVGAGDVPDFTQPAKEIVHVGEFGGVIALFEKAKEYLKYPKITLALPDGSPLQLNLAGNGSKFPGTVGLTDGGSYGDNKWYGRVTKEGAWEPAKLSDQLKTDLSSILAQLATQPAQLAAKHGKLTGHCCFCNSELSDEKSTNVGYGPVCAKRWGLPHGSKAN